MLRRDQAAAGLHRRLRDAALTGLARYEWVMDRGPALIAAERAAVPPAAPEPVRASTR